MFNAGAWVTLCALHTCKSCCSVWLCEEAARETTHWFCGSNYLRICAVGSQPERERENSRWITESTQTSHPHTFLDPALLESIRKRYAGGLLTVYDENLSCDKHKYLWLPHLGPLFWRNETMTALTYDSYLKIPLHLSRNKISLVISFKSSPRGLCSWTEISVSI